MSDHELRLEVLRRYSEASALRAALQARYPSVRVREVDFRVLLHLNVVQQDAKFEGTIEQFLACGLIDARMIEQRHKCGPCTPLGDGFTLHVEDDEARLVLFTGSVPREREKFSVRDAERLLRRFTLRKRDSRN